METRLARKHRLPRSPHCRLAVVVALLVAFWHSTTWDAGSNGSALAEDQPAAAETPSDRSPTDEQQAAAERRLLIRRLSQMSGVWCVGVEKSNQLQIHIDSPEATDATVQMLEPLKRHIRVLILARGNFSEAIFDTIAEFKSLKSLTLDHPTLSESAAKKLAGLPKLESLRIDNCSQLNDAVLQQLESWPALESLNLSGVANQITDQGLGHLAALPVLATLCISSDTITDDGLRRLAQSKSLSTLSLQGRSFGPEGLRQLKSAHLLTDLRLFECRQLDDHALAAIGELSQLRSLSIEGGLVTDAGLVHLNGLADLSTLSLENSRITGAGLEQLTELTDLFSLTMLGKNVSNKVFAHIHHFPNLTILTVGAGKPTDRRLITDEGLKLIGLAPELGWLHLKGTVVTNQGLEALESLPGLAMVYSWDTPGLGYSWQPRARLPLTAAVRRSENPAAEDQRKKVLEVLGKRGATFHEDDYINSRQFRGQEAGNGWLAVKIKDPQANDETLAILPLLVGVQSLVLKGAQFTDTSFESIASLPDLEHLTLDSVTLSTARLEKLTLLPRLIGLELQDCALTDEALVPLKDCRTIKSLTIDGRNNRITFEGFAHLAACPSLRSLGLHRLSSDEGIEALSNSKSLSELAVFDQTISDAALRRIAALGNLRRLYLRNVSLTSQGVRQLKSAARLRYLEIADCPQLDDDALTSIGELTQLRQLTLHSDVVTDAGLRHLNRLKDLQVLTLHSSQVTGAGLAPLTALAELGQLQLKGQRLSNDVFAHLDQFPKLKSLFLDGSDSDQPKITDDGLKQIGKLPYLSQIFFMGTGLTDQGLSPLAELPRLGNVNFSASPGVSVSHWQP